MVTVQLVARAWRGLKAYLHYTGSSYDLQIRIKHESSRFSVSVCEVGGNACSNMSVSHATAINEDRCLWTIASKNVGSLWRVVVI